MKLKNKNKTNKTKLKHAYKHKYKYGYKHLFTNIQESLRKIKKKNGARIVSGIGNDCKVIDGRRSGLRVAVEGNEQCKS